MTDTRQLLTAAQAAERLNISVRTVQRWAESGRLQYEQRLDNGMYLFDAGTVDGMVTPIRPDRCAVCGGLNPGDVTHTRC